MQYPLAYFLTWTCYATWLHGDERGSVDPAHNQFGRPVLEPDAAREHFEKNRAKHDPVLMSEAFREVVRGTVEDHCRIRAWPLHAFNVRTNHIHVVLTAARPPEEPLVQFKAWCTRRLRDARLVAAEQRVWTTHGSTRYLWDQKSLVGAVKYVIEGQGADLD